jgi:DNA-binding XRE family transcriptional regulator
MASRIHAKVQIDAARLRAVRIERELTQQSLAKQAGMPCTTVNRIESEVYRSVEIITKRALEAVLGVDLTPSRRPSVGKGNLPEGGRSRPPQEQCRHSASG